MVQKEMAEMLKMEVIDGVAHHLPSLHSPCSEGSVDYCRVHEGSVSYAPGWALHCFSAGRLPCLQKGKASFSAPYSLVRHVCSTFSEPQPLQCHVATQEHLQMDKTAAIISCQHPKVPRFFRASWLLPPVCAELCRPDQKGGPDLV